MKKLLALAIVVVYAACFNLNVNAENKKITFTVEPPLVCINCETKVKENLRFEKGVKSVKPSAKKGIVEVTYDDSKTTVENLKNGLQKIGYEATPVDQNISNPDCSKSPECKEVNNSCCRKEGNNCCPSSK